MALNGRYQREMAAFTTQKKNAHKSTPTHQHTHSSYKRTHTNKNRKFVKCLTNIVLQHCIEIYNSLASHWKIFVNFEDSDRKFNQQQQ